MTLNSLHTCLRCADPGRRTSSPKNSTQSSSSTDAPVPGNTGLRTSASRRPPRPCHDGSLTRDVKEDSLHLLLSGPSTLVPHQTSERDLPRPSGGSPTRLLGVRPKLLEDGRRGKGHTSLTPAVAFLLGPLLDLVVGIQAVGPVEAPSTVGGHDGGEGWTQSRPISSRLHTRSTKFGEGQRNPSECPGPGTSPSVTHRPLPSEEGRRTENRGHGRLTETRVSE